MLRIESDNDVSCDPKKIGEEIKLCFPIGSLNGESVNICNHPGALPVGLSTREAEIDSILSKGGIVEVNVEQSSGLYDKFSDVYINSDKMFTLNLVPGAYPVGFVVRWISGILCKVRLFGMTESYFLKKILEN